MKLFEQMLQDAGVPTTREAMRARWDAINDEQGGQITNNSKWSPFWRLISAIVTEPCVQLVGVLKNHALPNVFLRYASGRWLDVYAWGVDLMRKPATSAAGSVTFTRETAAGELLIPAGTVVESPTLGGYVYRLATTQDVTAVDGQLTATAPVRAERVGSAYNLGPGYYSILPQPVPGVASVTNAADWLGTPGADEEQDEELRLRCRTQFSAVGQYHHDAAYTADIATFAGIRTDYIYFRHDAPRGPGSADCFIMLETGTPSAEFIDSINAHVRDSGNHGHGDDLRCWPMPQRSIDLTATVHPVPHLPAQRQDALRQRVADMIRAAFRDNADYDVTRTWPFSRFSFSQLAEELHAACADLRSVEFSQGDILTGMELPVLGTLSVVMGAE